MGVDLEKFPRFTDARKWRGRLEQGDILYIPHSFWHQVNSYGRRNLAVNVWWGLQNEWKWRFKNFPNDQYKNDFAFRKEHFSNREQKCTAIDKPKSRYSIGFG